MRGALNDQQRRLATQAAVGIGQGVHKARVGPAVAQQGQRQRPAAKIEGVLRAGRRQGRLRGGRGQHHPRPGFGLAGFTDGGGDRFIIRRAFKKQHIQRHHPRPGRAHLADKIGIQGARPFRHRPAVAVKAGVVHRHHDHAVINGLWQKIDVFQGQRHHREPAPGPQGQQQQGQQQPAEQGITQPFTTNISVHRLPLLPQGAPGTGVASAPAPALS